MRVCVQLPQLYIKPRYFLITHEIHKVIYYKIELSYLIGINLRRKSIKIEKKYEKTNGYKNFN